MNNNTHFDDEILIEYDEDGKVYLDFSLFLDDETYMDFGKRSGCFEQANINSIEEMIENAYVSCYCDILKDNDGKLRAKVTICAETDKEYICEEVPISDEEQEFLIKIAQEYVKRREGKDVTLESLMKSNETDDNFEPLNFYQCLQLIDALIKFGALTKDPANPNNIIIIRGASKTQPDVYPAGRYSENIHDVAQELMSDISDQQTLLRLLKQRSKEEISFPKSPFER